MQSTCMKNGNIVGSWRNYESITKNKIIRWFLEQERIFKFFQKKKKKQKQEQPKIQTRRPFSRLQIFWFSWHF